MPNAEERPRWFSRRFAFDLEPWMFPNVIERVRGTPARLEERLRGLDKPTLTTRLDGRWSIQENAGHLLDLESLWAERLDDLERGAERLSAADLENRKTHDANHNGVDVTTLLADFQRARLDIVRRLEGYDEAFVIRSALHPRLAQPMRTVDLVLFVAEHDDHHLATITGLRRALVPAATSA
jgi:uncharacterized damage-inducible protein DinB